MSVARLRPERIVHYLPRINLAAGGVVRAVLDCCSVLSERGNDVTLVTCDATDVPAGWDGSARKPRLQTIAGNADGLFLPGAAISKWREILKVGQSTDRSTVVHFHTPWSTHNIQLARICRQSSVRYAVSLHGMLDKWSMAQRSLKKKVFLALAGRSFLRHAARLHYTAAAEQDQAQRWIVHPDEVVIPCLIDLAPYQELPGPELAYSTFGIQHDVPTILFLSRLHEKKGVHLLIDAADTLHSAGEHFQLIIAGSAAPADASYEDRLKRMVAEKGLTKRVRFVGAVAGREKISLYQAADLYVLPTQQENFGIVLIEAMAAGTPVVTTRGTDIWQEIQSGGGTIADATATAFSAAIKNALKDRPATLARGNRSREWVFQRFATQTIAEGYERLYKNGVRSDINFQRSLSTQR